VSRGVLVSVAFTLMFVATAAARTAGQAARPKTLATVPGPIVALAQDGRQIAWVRSEGTSVQILAVSQRRPISLGPRPPANCAHSRCFLFHAVAVSAAGRVLWQELADAGNTYYTLSAFTASRRAPRRQSLKGTYMGIEDGNPDWVDPLPVGLPMTADGNAMLFYAACDSGELCSYDPRVPSGIYRVVGRRSRLLAKVRRPAALAVSGRRFAVVTNSFRCCNFYPVWSHEGTRVAWIYHGKLWTIRADGTDDRQVAAGVAEPHWPSDVTQPPTWSPDGTQLVFVRMGRDKKRFWPPRSLGVFRVGVNGRGLRRIAAGTAPAWSPDGTTIAFVRGNGVFGIRPDGTGGRRLTTTARTTQAHLSWSPDSKWIAVSRGGDIYSVRADGAGETRLTTSRRREIDPAWSPDGSRIAYADAGNITIVNADGTGARRLSRATGESPAWSPDSKRLAFVAEDGLSLVNADGSDRPRLLRSVSYPDSPQWAPAGETILVGQWAAESTDNPRDPGIRVVSPVSGKVQKIAPVLRSTVELRDALRGRLVKRFTARGHTQAAAVGPGYVALLIDHDPGLRVDVYNLNGRLRTAAAVPRSVHSVSAAGRTIVFATSRDIRHLDARTGAVTTLVTPRREPEGVSIEGRRVVWAENDRGGARIRAVTAP
jgi:dipeptidyl aminopeptidase/acylaminoacyl peptidase